jgi:Ca-activated chloride channel family protein
MRLVMGIGLISLGLLLQVFSAQTIAQEPYTMNVAVDEVSVTFHVADFNGVPMDDLSLADLRLTDNGKKPRQIVSFEVHKSLPVRLGILVDTSRSVLDDLRLNQTIAAGYMQRYFHPAADHGFVMRFDSNAKVTQDWTTDRGDLMAGLASVASDAASRMGGTALFDALYRACRDQFGKTANVEAGNFILLFSDGVDNASHARLEDDVTMCQSTNTAIYVFSKESEHFLSEGQKTLRDLAMKSGGHIFFDQNQTARLSDLQLLDRNLRSQYRLVYRPDHLKRDGVFHRIRLDSPDRGGVITTRSGYYAPR